MYIPDNRGYPLLGDGSVYTADDLDKLTISFADSLFIHQNIAVPAHHNSANEYVSAVPVPMQCKHEIMSTLMLSQLECEDHQPTEAEINRKNEMKVLHFSTTLAACMTFITVCLPGRFPLSLFNQVEFSESNH